MSEEIQGCFPQGNIKATQNWIVPNEETLNHLKDCLCEVKNGKDWSYSSSKHGHGKHGHPTDEDFRMSIQYAGTKLGDGDCITVRSNSDVWQLKDCEFLLKSKGNSIGQSDWVQCVIPAETINSTNGNPDNTDATCIKSKQVPVGSNLISIKLDINNILLGSNINPDNGRKIFTEFNGYLKIGDNIVPRSQFNINSRGDGAADDIFVETCIKLDLLTPQDIILFIKVSNNGRFSTEASSLADLLEGNIIINCKAEPYKSAEGVPSKLDAANICSGIVSLNCDALPLEGIPLKFKQTNGYDEGQAITDASGNYAVGPLKEGEYTIEIVTDPEAVNDRYPCGITQPTLGLSVLVLAGATTKDFVIDAVPVITGHVVDATGNPVDLVASNATIEFKNATGGIELSALPKPQGDINEYIACEGDGADILTITLCEFRADGYNDLDVTPVVPQGGMITRCINVVDKEVVKTPAVGCLDASSFVDGGGSVVPWNSTLHNKVDNTVIETILAVAGVHQYLNITADLTVYVIGVLDGYPNVQTPNILIQDKAKCEDTAVTFETPDPSFLQFCATCDGAAKEMNNSILQILDETGTTILHSFSTGKGSNCTDIFSNTILAAGNYILRVLETNNCQEKDLAFTVTGVGTEVFTVDTVLIIRSRKSGIVTDDNGAPIHGMQVILKLAGLVVSFATTGDEGNYEFTGLENGVYTVVFTGVVLGDDKYLPQEFTCTINGADIILNAIMESCWSLLTSFISDIQEPSASQLGPVYDGSIVKIKNATTLATLETYFYDSKDPQRAENCHIDGDYLIEFESIITSNVFSNTVTINGAATDVATIVTE